MDNTATNNQAASSVEDTAHQTANNLLMDAVDAIGVIIPPHVDSTAAAILIVGHALIAKLDSMEATHIDALRDLRESIDYLAARADEDEAGEVPTSEEQTIIYRALEADYMARGNSPSIKETDAALLRFKKLAARPKGGVAGEGLTHDERWVVFQALESEYLARDDLPVPGEQDDALCRLARLVGL